MAKTKTKQPLTTAQQLGSLIKSARDIMRKDKGLNGDLDRLPMLTWVMFLKFFDDLEGIHEQKAALAGKPYKSMLQRPYRWRDWAAKEDGITGDDLIRFINQAIMLAGENDEVFEELLRLNGSSAGARPKIVAQVSADKTRIIHGQQKLQLGFAHWIIKFASSQDPGDVGAIEYAYSLMAKDAGVDMPETHLFRTKKRAYFGARRFDREGDRRLHVHSLSGLTHADHRTPTLDYDTILRVALLLTKSVVAVEKAYALACFNVLAHNRDDHAKNFSFLLTDRNEWVFAPAYDLTFSYGPGGEQSTMVMGEGRNPGAEHLGALGKKHALKKAPDILAKVQAAIVRWRLHADQAGLRTKSAIDIANHHLAVGK
jgi:serine/threonine-protein kinase HipA